MKTFSSIIHLFLCPLSFFCCYVLQNKRKMRIFVPIIICSENTVDTFTIYNYKNRNMQTVNLQYNVPVGYSLEEFVDKVNSYVARLAKRSKSEKEPIHCPNDETKEALKEAYTHIEAYKKGEKWAKEGTVNTSSVEAMLKSCGV